METTLATILITAAVTVAVIGLGALVWAIAQLKHRASCLEGLCRGFENQFQTLYIEMDNRDRNHGDNLKGVKDDTEKQIQDVWRKFDEQHDLIGRQVEWLSDKDDKIHQRIDRNGEELEKNLDRRFDSVYRKIHSIQNKVTLTSPELVNQEF